MIDEDDWDEYAGAGFTWWPDVGDAISVGPRPDGLVVGGFPLDRPACFVTAHNPGGPVIAADVNDQRHAALLGEIAAHGWIWHPAVGGDPGGSHTEDGVLLLDAFVHDALALAGRFEQDAIYVWRADTFELIACDGSRHDRFGWTAEVGATTLPAPTYRP